MLPTLQPDMLHIPTDIDPVEQEFCEDGFHPSAESCSFWAKELAQRYVDFSGLN
jgi:hypothetical protein